MNRAVNGRGTRIGPLITKAELRFMQKRFEERGISLVGLSLDQDTAVSVPAFLEQLEIDYPVYTAGEAEELPTGELPGAQAVVEARVRSGGATAAGHQ